MRQRGENPVGDEGLAEQRPGEKTKGRGNGRIHDEAAREMARVRDELEFIAMKPVILVREHVQDKTPE